MAAINRALFTLAICLILSSPWGSAQITPVQQARQLRGDQWQHECNIEQLNAAEPTQRIKAEAGVVEIWEPNDQQFRCAGVAAVRHVIEPNGLLIPSFTSAPYITYVVQGRGVQGVIVPGCPNTFESETRDHHQKVFKVREGDVIGSPPGVIQWTYNNGDTPLISVTLLDLSNSQNQLDLNFRSFYLAGNPRGQGGEQGQRGERKVDAGGNLFNGFEDDFLEDIFQVDTKTIRMMKGENDERGSIIRADQASLGELMTSDSERMTTSVDNGIEETLCTMKFVHNIDESADVDLFNPLAGRVSILNGHSFPLLQSLQLSATRIVLHKNGIITPHWTINAHSVMYVTRGSGWIQVAGENGQLAFDGQVQEGQMLVIPQSFVVVKKAEQEGLEFITFKTNDNAMISPLTGRVSAIRGLPEEVLMNSYVMSRDEVKRLKYGNVELGLSRPTVRVE